MANTHGGAAPDYYVPAPAQWPMVGMIAMAFTGFGAAMVVNHNSTGYVALAIGLAVLAYMMIGWFSQVSRESEGGMYNERVDVSFRWSMSWFIFSEVMFFAAFFGALFYARMFSVPWIGGVGDGAMTNALLWPEFAASWPTNGPGNVGGAFETIPAWGLPLLNTLILLTSGVTITIAHHALKEGKRGILLLFLGLTVLLGCVFLFYQAEEYIHAYHELNLTMGSGIYGSTFFMLTGFHGAHVTLGAIMLTVIWFRCARGHFTAEHHFGFEAVAWYWHFVDVVWLGLFLFVYVL
mgnify:CR=1 FL=1